MRKTKARKPLDRHLDHQPVYEPVPLHQYGISPAQGETSPVRRMTGST
jgi:hypothetical protein